MPRQLPLPSQKHIALAMAVNSCPHLPGWRAHSSDERYQRLRLARRTIRNLAKLGFEIVSVRAVKVKRGAR